MERAGYPPMQPLPPEAYDRDMAVVDRAIVFGIRGAATGVRTQTISLSNGSGATRKN